MPEQRSIMIDGEQRSGVLIEVDLPDGLSLRSGELLDIVAYQAIAVVQHSGAGNQWMRYDQWTGLTSIDRFGLLVPREEFTLDEIQSAIITLEVESDAENGLVNVSGGVNLDGLSDREIEFSPICFDIVALGTASFRDIRFIEPSIALQKQGTTPNFNLDQDFIDAPVYRLKTNDIELRNNSDSYRLSLNGVYVELSSTLGSQQAIIGPSGARFVIVGVESSLTGDNLELLLRETASGSNIFRSVRPILLSEELTANGAYCPGGSGALPSEPDFERSDDICALQSVADDTLVTRFIDDLSRARIQRHGGGRPGQSCI